MAKLMNEIREKAKAVTRHIVLAEGEEERIVRAAAKIAAEKICKVTILGDEKKIAKFDVDLGDVTIINPEKSDKLEGYANLLHELRKAKGMTAEQALLTAKDVLYFGVLMVKSGDADGMVAGAIHSTGDVLRPALQILKTAPGISTVSSSFIMELADGIQYGDNGILVFGDCAVNIDPTAEELASIAISSAETAQSIAGISPRVAMLSFSTKGSAKHELVDKVTKATELVKAQQKGLVVDGELQADAALVSSVGALKAPNSEVAGKANVLIFPDIQSGNIGYKLVQRLGGAEAIGPVCQGMAKPVNDLSRGCSVEDVVSVAAITALQCK